jgi:hypothetical protein
MIVILPNMYAAVSDSAGKSNNRFMRVSRTGPMVSC